MKNNLLRCLRVSPLWCMIMLMTLQQLSAQCTATYTVGSNTAYPLLSTAPAGVSALTSGQSVKINGTFTVDAGT